MTVLENVEVAAACRPRRGRRTPARAAVRRTLASLGLGSVAQTVASTLPYGVQRRVEIARAIVAEPRFVLLDEPAAGLNEAESDDLLATVLSIRDEVGCGILIIDHDLRLIMRGTERIYVLDDGRVISEGTPEAVRVDPRVIAAYLGA
jgi:ABC-type branched-subunit amino acid transport system ATPase component